MEAKKLRATWAMRSTVIGMSLMACLGSQSALAQQKYKYSYQLPSEIKNVYKQVQSTEVGDVPEHRVRYAELQTIYPPQLPAPLYAGIRVKESNTVLIGEQVSGNGVSNGYGTLVLENGDKIFSRISIVLQTMTSEDGKISSKFDQVSHIVGGTGKFKNIRGVLRSSGRTDMKSSTSGNLTEGEYYFQE